MTVEEFLASACTRKNLNPMEHFVRVKKRRDMEDHNYFVPHRTDLIETYVSLKVSRFRIEYCISEGNRESRDWKNANRPVQDCSGVFSCLGWRLNLSLFIESIKFVSVKSSE